jgi:hypothetical protein
MEPEHKVAYYELIRPLPSLAVGTMVSPASDDGGPYWICGPLVFPDDFPTIYPDWFRPVSQEEHRERCRVSLTKEAERRGYTYEQVVAAFDEIEKKRLYGYGR